MITEHVAAHLLEVAGKVLKLASEYALAVCSQVDLVGYFMSQIVRKSVLSSFVFNSPLYFLQGGRLFRISVLWFCVLELKCDVKCERSKVKVMLCYVKLARSIKRMATPQGASQRYKARH